MNKGDNTYSPTTADEAGKQDSAAQAADIGRSFPPDACAACGTPNTLQVSVMKCGGCQRLFCTRDCYDSPDHACKSTPSKPCTEGGEPPWCKCEGWEPLCLCKPQSCLEGGEHCFCVGRGAAYTPGEMVRWHVCCWCETRDDVQPVPGHGKFRTELVRE